MYSKLLCSNELNSEAPVAQLDRASVYGTEGRGFEPLQARLHDLLVINDLRFLPDAVRTWKAGLAPGWSSSRIGRGRQP